MGFKTFVPGTTLTAGDVNEYLMKQSVIVCTSSTRPSSPVEGMTIYQTDTDNQWFYDGATWLPTGGLQPMKPSSVTGGSATGNIVTFSNQASVTVNGVFTNNYNQYRVLISYYNNSATSAYSRLQVTVGGTAQTSSYVSKSIWTNMGVASVVWQDYDSPNNAVAIGATGASTYPSQVSLDVAYPASSSFQSYWTGTFSGTQPTVANYTGMIGGVWQSTTAFDGFKVFAATGQNISGEIRVYGYR
jgi:hypothetical protein